MGCKSHERQQQCSFQSKEASESTSPSTSGKWHENVFFSLFLRSDVSLILPKHTCGKTRADSFQDIAVLSSYNTMAALLGQMPPGRTRCLKNEAAFLEQRMTAPNPTGANRQECCNRKTLLGAEWTSLSPLLQPHKANSCFTGLAPVLTRISMLTGRAGGRWASCPGPSAG